MMPIRLAVGSEVHDLRTGATLACCRQPSCQLAPVVQQATERDRMREGGVVEENRDRAPGTNDAAIRTRAVDVAVTHLFPWATAIAHTCRLMRSQDGEADAILGQD